MSSKIIDLTNAEVITLLAAIYDAKEHLAKTDRGNSRVAYRNSLDEIAQRLAKAKRQLDLAEVKERQKRTL